MFLSIAAQLVVYSRAFRVLGGDTYEISNEMVKETAEKHGLSFAIDPPARIHPKIRFFRKNEFP